jgi:hypothetical protein
MSFLEPKIRKTTITFLAFALVQASLLIYLLTTVGYKVVDEKTKSAVALTGLFVLVVFVIAFGKVYYQKTAENNKKKKTEKEKLAKYEHANFVLWVSLFFCTLAGAYFYAVRQDLSYIGISGASFGFFLYSFPSLEKFKNDFY